MNHLARAMQAKRLETGQTVEDLADEFDVKQPTVSRWLNAKARPRDLKSRTAIARWLGVTVDEVIVMAETEADLPLSVDEILDVVLGAIERKTDDPNMRLAMSFAAPEIVAAMLREEGRSMEESQITDAFMKATRPIFAEASPRYKAALREALANAAQREPEDSGWVRFSPMAALEATTPPDLDPEYTTAADTDTGDVGERPQDERDTARAEGFDPDEDPPA